MIRNLCYGYFLFYFLVGIFSALPDSTDTLVCKAYTVVATSDNERYMNACEFDFVDLEETQMPYSVKAFSIYLAEHGKITGKRKMYLHLVVGMEKVKIILQAYLSVFPCPQRKGRFFL